MTSLFTAPIKELTTHIDSKEGLPHTSAKQLKKQLLPLLEEWHLDFIGAVTGNNAADIEQKLLELCIDLIDEVINEGNLLNKEAQLNKIQRMYTTLQNYCYEPVISGGLGLDTKRIPSNIMYKGLPIDLKKPHELSRRLSQQIDDASKGLLNKTLKKHSIYSIATGRILMPHGIEIMIKHIESMQSLDGLTAEESMQFNRTLAELPHQIGKLLTPSTYNKYWMKTRTSNDKELATLIINILCDIGANQPIDQKIAKLTELSKESSINSEFSQSLQELLKVIATHHQYGKSTPKLDTTMHESWGREIWQQQRNKNEEFNIFESNLIDKHTGDLKTKPKTILEADKCAEVISYFIANKYNSQIFSGTTGTKQATYDRLIIQHGLAKLLRAPFDLRQARVITAKEKDIMLDRLSQLPKALNELENSRIPTDVNSLLNMLYDIGLNKPSAYLQDMTRVFLNRCLGAKEEFTIFDQDEGPTKLQQGLGETIKKLISPEIYNQLDHTMSPELSHAVKLASKGIKPNPLVLGGPSSNAHTATVQMA